MTHKELVGKKVQIYWNLHKSCFSVRYRGKVVLHTMEILLNNVRFQVSEKGRQRVLREKRKNVHAFVNGIVTNSVPENLDVTIGYNPYKFGYFYNKLNEEIVTTAKFAKLINKQIMCLL